MEEFMGPEGVFHDSESVEYLTRASWALEKVFGVAE